MTVTLLDVMAAAGDVILQFLAADGGLLSVKETCKCALHLASAFENGTPVPTPRSQLLRTDALRERFGMLFSNFGHTSPSMCPPKYLKTWRSARSNSNPQLARTWRETFFILEAADASDGAMVARLMNAPCAAFISRTRKLRARLTGLLNEACATPSGATVVAMCAEHAPLRTLVDQCTVSNAVSSGTLATVDALIAHDFIPERLVFDWDDEPCTTAFELALRHNTLDVVVRLYRNAPRYGQLTPLTLTHAAANDCCAVLEWALGELTLGHRVTLAATVERLCMANTQTPWMVYNVNRLLGTPVRSVDMARVLKHATPDDIAWFCDTRNVEVNADVLFTAARVATADVLLEVCTRAQFVLADPHAVEEDIGTTCATTAQRLARSTPDDTIATVVRALAARGVPLGHLRAAAAFWGNRALADVARELGADFGDARSRLCTACGINSDVSDAILERALFELGGSAWNSTMITLLMDGVLPWAPPSP